MVSSFSDSMRTEKSQQFRGYICSCLIQISSVVVYNTNYECRHAMLRDYLARLIAQDILKLKTNLISFDLESNISPA